MVPVDEYRWLGAERELLLRFEPRSPAASGWDADYMFFQPGSSERLTVMRVARLG